MSKILQRLTLPSFALNPSVDLYVRLFGGAKYVYSEREIRFDRNSAAVFDTYFNTFSVGKWQRHTAIADLRLRVELKGKFLLRVVENRFGAAPAVIADTLVDHKEMSLLELDIPVASLAGGSLFVAVESESRGGVLQGGGWLTSDLAIRDVRIGIVITTYNRQDYIRNNLAALSSAASADPDLKHNMHVVVVDNASNLHLENQDWLTYLRNDNLGGAGGFSRGLYELKRMGGFTHALFMDDDIRFEVDSIRRAAALLAYATDPDVSICGAMFLESDSAIQYEACASFQFDNPYDPIRKYGVHMDMRDVCQVLKNDRFDYPAEYGAWWFFLFPIHLSGSDLAFPLFLRGDDIIFGYRYAKRLLTLNGICVWHMPFEYKDSPTTLYFSQRNFEVVRAVAGAKRIPTLRALRFVVKTVLQDCFRYRYTSASYRIRAYRDFLRGPKWWQSMDPIALNQQLRAGDDEKLGPLTILPEMEGYEDYASTHNRSLLRRLAQTFTLNGHLVPRFLFKLFGGDQKRWVRPHQQSWTAPFLQERVLVYYEPANEGFELRHSKARFFRNVADLAAIGVALVGNYQRVRKEYRSSYAGLVSEKAWEGRFGLPVQADRGADPDDGSKSTPSALPRAVREASL
jgi:GT2 family glycosyltransferase